MNKLVSIEFLKLRKQITFKVMLLVYIVLMPLILLGIGAFVENIQLPIPILPTMEDMFSFPSIWNYATYAASFLNLLMGVVVVVSTTNDIKFKTLRQNVIDGMSKSEVILSKFIFIILLAVFVTAYTALVSTIFGVAFSDEMNYFDDIYFLGIYFLQTIGYFTFAFLLTILLKIPILSILIYVFSMIINAIVVAFIPVSVGQYLPLTVLGDMTPFPPVFNKITAQMAENGEFELPELISDSTRLIVGSIYILAMIGLSYFILKRRDV